MNFSQNNFRLDTLCRVWIPSIGLSAFILVGCNNEGDSNEIERLNAESAKRFNEQGSESNKAELNIPEGEANVPAPNPKVPPTTNSVPPVENSKPPKAGSDSKLPKPFDVPDVPPVIGKGQKGWQMAPGTAEAIFAGMDESLAKLQNARVSFDMVANLPEGKGTFQNACVVADKNRYRLSYVRFIQKPQPRFEEYLVATRKNGVETLDGDKFVKGRKYPELGKLDDLHLTITHQIASVFGTNQKPFTALLKSARKAGWNVSVENRNFDMGVFQRVLLEPKGSKRRYEFVINPREKMPTNIRMQVNQGDKVAVVQLNLKYEVSRSILTEKDLDLSVSTPEFKGMRSEEEIDREVEKQKQEQKKLNKKA